MSNIISATALLRSRQNCVSRFEISRNCRPASRSSSSRPWIETPPINSSDKIEIGEMLARFRSLARTYIESVLIGSMSSSIEWQSNWPQHLFFSHFVTVTIPDGTVLGRQSRHSFQWRRWRRLDAGPLHVLLPAVPPSGALDHQSEAGQGSSTRLSLYLCANITANTLILVEISVLQTAGCSEPLQRSDVRWSSGRPRHRVRLEGVASRTGTAKQ